MNFIIKKNITILEAMKKMENSKKKIICLVDQKKNLKGIITDGDIRTALIKNISLKDKVEKILNKNPITAKYEMNLKEISNLIIKHKINSIPVIKKKKIIDVKTFEELIGSNLKNFDVIINAGGLGTRLLPLTKNKPKCLVKIHQRAILDIIISKFKKFGFCKINIIINHYGQKIVHHCKKIKDKKLYFNFFNEKQPLGTAGGLFFFRKNKDISKNFIFINSDIISGINYKSLVNYHEEIGADLTVVSYKKKIPIEYGKILVKNMDLSRIDEKPTFEININAGIYIINKRCLNILKKEKKIDMNEFIARLKKNNFKVKIFPCYEYWFDIGSKDQLEECKKFIKK